MLAYVCVVFFACFLSGGICRDEEKIMKACFWANEVYEPCFGGCAEVSCDNPRSHLRPCYPYCEPGCVCEEPYVRDDRTHQCVLPQDCSPTQMGIPVPNTKRSTKSPPSFMPLTEQLKYSNNLGPRNKGTKRDELDSAPPRTLPDNAENEALPAVGVQLGDPKRSPEISRMGNYFNIVIAPPPIKALQPRKMMQPDAFGGAAKRN